MFHSTGFQAASLVVSVLSRDSLSCELCAQWDATQLCCLCMMPPFRDLSRNQLSGSIPASFTGLRKIKLMYLYNNKLSGSIPIGLGSLTNRAALFIYNNSLSGSIPTGLGSLTKLLALDLSGNSLSGPIPSAIGNMRDLKHLFQTPSVVVLAIVSFRFVLPMCVANVWCQCVVPMCGANVWCQCVFRILTENNLSGSIPPSLEGLLFLQRL
ncbi:unnamed protein product [Closterium sp. NIES-54]